MDFCKEIIQELIFQYRIFIKSIISHPFQSIFKAIIVSTKSWPPLPTYCVSVIVCHKQMGGQVSGGGGGSNSADGCRATLSLRPNSSESKKSLVFFQSINFLWFKQCRSQQKVLQIRKYFFWIRIRGSIILNLKKRIGRPINYRSGSGSF